MENEIVVARGFRGQPFLVRVCEVKRDIVFVTGETNYEKIRNGVPSVTPVGVPRSEVFRYDGTLYNQLLSDWHDNPRAWERMTKWKEEAQI